MSTWINFTELRQQLKFGRVLEFYGIKVTRKGDQHIGQCPLPTHGSSKQGNSFSANLARGIFRCFGCRTQGNVLEFAAFMEGFDPKDGKALRSVAVKLQKECLEQHVPPAPVAPTLTRSNSVPKPRITATVVNAPLDFELKGLDYEHPYLRQFGFTTETIRHFGLGVASRGSLKGMMAVPLHNQDGRLVGYAGHPIDCDLRQDDTPEYRLPDKREHNGIQYDFRRDRLLYNAQRIQGPVEDLIVVSDFASVWWLHQNGFPNVVSTMGECSSRQAELLAGLVKPKGRVWLPLRGEMTHGVSQTRDFAKIAEQRSVRVWRLPPDGQVVGNSLEQLGRLVST